MHIKDPNIKKQQSTLQLFKCETKYDHLKTKKYLQNFNRWFCVYITFVEHVSNFSRAHRGLLLHGCILAV